MNVVISQRRDKNKHGEWIDSLEASYLSFFSRHGIKLVVLPNSSYSIEELLSHQKIDGVILSGGNDVGLNQDKQNWTESVSSQRDKQEGELLDWAIQNHRPVFGICRGMQFIQAYFGGEICSDLNGEKNISHPVAESHEVVLTKMENYLKINSPIFVNSYHNQGVVRSKLVNELEVFCTDKTGVVVEGLFHSELPIVAIQWHPERGETTQIDEVLVKAFKKTSIFWNKG